MLAGMGAWVAQLLLNVLKMRRGPRLHRWIGVGAELWPSSGDGHKSASDAPHAVHVEMLAAPCSHVRATRMRGARELTRRRRDAL